MFEFLKKEIRLPVIQGGMGIGVSLGNLSGHVAKEGAIGTISMVAPGYNERDFLEDQTKANERAFKRELKKAREISEGNGLIGANIMVALSDYEELVKLAVDSSVDFIVAGAGLPLNLPELVPEEVPIAPIVSSARTLKLLMRRWKKWNRLPDFVIVEGLEAGGHLGFKKVDKDFSLEKLTTDILDHLKSEDLKIPVFVAGGLSGKKDYDKYRELGAFGIQLGTRFLATEEADCHESLKKKIVESTTKDLEVFESPVGLLGRGIENDFLKSVKKERKPSTYCIRCIKTCNPKTTRYCIYERLIASVTGKVDEGLLFAGTSIDDINEILTVEEVLEEFVED